METTSFFVKLGDNIIKLACTTSLKSIMSRQLRKVQILTNDESSSL
jgi:hypothetical protein